MTSTSGANDADATAEQAAPAVDGSRADAIARLQQLVQNVAVLAAILYVVGLLTTNAYLYSLGVSDFSLLRARFVLTGLVTLMPFAIALVGGLYAADDVAAFAVAGGGAGRVFRWLLRDVAIPFALFFLLYVVLFWYAAADDVGEAVRAAALLTVTCTMLVVALLGGLAMYQVIGRHSPGIRGPRRRSRVLGQFTEWIGLPDPAFATVALAVGGPLLVLTFIGWFGHHVYPEIPEQLGGGQPRLVQLLIAPGAIPAARELGLQVSPDSPVTPPLELVWEGDDTYVIRLPDPREGAIVQLAGDLVDGLVTRPPE
jgi:hypothetical protein